MTHRAVDRHLKGMSRIAFFTVVLGTLGLAAGAAQQPAAIDVEKIGPQVGATAPAFSGTDQLGRTQTLASALGAKGAMLVFFRSADW